MSNGNNQKIKKNRLYWWSYLFIFGLADSAWANQFIDDSTLTGNIYYWYQDRDRKNIESHQYEANITQSTFNANLDFKSGYIHDLLAIELGSYASWDTNTGGAAHPNEISFSSSQNRWDEVYGGERSGLSMYKAQLNLKYDESWLHLGFIQPSGQTLIAPTWSLLPGTYQGAETGTRFDFANWGNLSLSYMWANRYKASWYQHYNDFRHKNGETKISYIHSLGFKYDFKNNLVLEAAYGESKNYLYQYFTKISYTADVFNHPLSMSYQFYGSKDQDHKGANVYDGLAWLQALTLAYQFGPANLKLEGVAIKAEGEQGYFLQRMTPTYATSGGRLDIWWDARSDFNANGEKVIFTGVDYDLGSFHSILDGFKAGVGYVYGWDAKPNALAARQDKRIQESAWVFDLKYTVQQGWAKDTYIGLHYTDYNNHSAIASWGGGYDNVFQDERDFKLLVIMPFSLF